MPVVRVAAAEEEDLKEIWSYIAQHNPEAASKAHQRNNEQVRYLAQSSTDGAGAAQIAY
jgi:plasmid stabilization system protein ParE